MFFLAASGEGNSEGRVSIKVPKVYWNYTRKSILTLEWIDGIKLTDAERIGKANLNRKRMIDEVLLQCCLTVNQHLYHQDCLQCFLSLYDAIGIRMTIDYLRSTGSFFISLYIMLEFFGAVHLGIS